MQASSDGFVCRVMSFLVATPVRAQGNPLQFWVEGRYLQDQDKTRDHNVRTGQGAASLRASISHAVSGCRSPWIGRQRTWRGSSMRFRVSREACVVWIGARSVRPSCGLRQGWVSSTVGWPPLDVLKMLDARTALFHS